MDLLREDLDAAVEAGVIDARARERLVAFATARRAGDAGPDAESFRLLTGFNDIFVTLACVLLLVAIASLLQPALAAAGVAAASWGLAEYFTRKRRMALPSILLLLAFVGGLFWAISALTGGVGLALTMAGAGIFPQGLGIAAAGAVVGAFLHWQRFRVPITLAAGAAGLVILAASLVNRFANETFADETRTLLITVLLSGLAVFALAMRYDMADRQRLTRNTDIAFWLHLLASPLIVHPIFTLTGVTGAAPSPGGAALVLLVYATLTLVALAIDRRALLVSALAYVLFALNGLFAAGQVAAGFGLTALILGSFLVMLSAAWAALRRPLLARLPPAWAARLPMPA